MQPLLLGKILRERIGANDFSNWIESGEDIYIKLQQAAGLETRDAGKKRFFEILFAPPSNGLSDIFGAADWITWINAYKRAFEPGNPHSKAKPYSNLAWLLQSTEVQTMRKVWKALNETGIPFLSVHDEIIVKQSDRHQAESLFRRVLDQEFTFYKLNVKSAIEDTQAWIDEIMQAEAETLTDAAVWAIIERQFTERFNPDEYLQPGKTSDEIFSDLTFLAADCFHNYGISVTPDQYYIALKLRESQLLNN